MFIKRFGHTEMRRLLYVALLLPLFVVRPMQEWINLSATDAFSVGAACSVVFVALIVGTTWRMELRTWEARSVYLPALMVILFWGLVLVNLLIDA